MGFMNAVIDAHLGREQPVSEVPAAQLSPTDLENLIELWRAIGTLEPSRTLKCIAFDRMRQLIAKRSPETVARMEQAKGLR